MKKFIVLFFSAFIAFSFSAIAFAANHTAPHAAKITKQLILAEDEPAPEPPPVPEPAPDPEPAPLPAPEPS